MHMHETHERVYSAVLQEIKTRLADGTLRAGCRLPPERICAEQFQVSRRGLRQSSVQRKVRGSCFGFAV